MVICYRGNRKGIHFHIGQGRGVGAHGELWTFAKTLGGQTCCKWQHQHLLGFPSPSLGHSPTWKKAIYIASEVICKGGKVSVHPEP